MSQPLNVSFTLKSPESPLSLPLVTMPPPAGGDPPPLQPQDQGARHRSGIEGRSLGARFRYFRQGTVFKESGIFTAE